MSPCKILLDKTFDLTSNLSSPKTRGLTTFCKWTYKLGQPIHKINISRYQDKFEKNQSFFCNFEILIPIKSIANFL